MAQALAPHVPATVAAHETALVLVTAPVGILLCGVAAGAALLGAVLLTRHFLEEKNRLDDEVKQCLENERGKWLCRIPQLRRTHELKSAEELRKKLCGDVRLPDTASTEQLLQKLRERHHLPEGTRVAEILSKSAEALQSDEELKVRIAERYGNPMEDS